MTSGTFADKMCVVVYKNYEWDEWKAQKNAHDHGVTFEEAVEVFDDPYALEECD